MIFRRTSSVWFPNWHHNAQSNLFWIMRDHVWEKSVWNSAPPDDGSHLSVAGSSLSERCWACTVITGTRPTRAWQTNSVHSLRLFQQNPHHFISFFLLFPPRSVSLLLHVINIYGMKCVLASFTAHWHWVEKFARIHDQTIPPASRTLQRRNAPLTEFTNAPIRTPKTVVA